MKADLQFNDKFSQQARSFISQCLERDPAKRLGHSGDARNHPWFQNVDFDKLLRKQYEMQYKPTIHLNKQNVDLSNFDKRFIDQEIDLEEFAMHDEEIKNQELFDMFEIDEAIAQKQVQEKFKKAVEEMKADEFVLET